MSASIALLLVAPFIDFRYQNRVELIHVGTCGTFTVSPDNRWVTVAAPR